jgi:putative ABC transport system permease protein
MESLIKDIRYSIRSLLKHRRFTMIAVITLALGIAANTAIFSVVNSVLLRPLPYPDSDHLMALREFNMPKQPDAQIAPGNFLEWRRQNPVFSALAAYRNISYNLTGDGDAERLLAGRVSAGLFTVLGVRPVLGRDFLAEEDQPGHEKVVLISYGLWQRRFGSDVNVIGRTLKLSGENFTVVGVLAAGFRLPDARERELWTPIAFTGNERELHNAHYVEAIARLKPGITLEQAQTEMNAIAARLAQQYPEANSGWNVRVTPLLDFVVGDAKAVLWLLVGAVGFVLLIVCVNVANLLLARAVDRQKEMAIRAALGAARLRVIRQLMTESVLLALVGGVVAWPLAVWGVQALLALAPQDLPRIATVTIDHRAFLFTLGIALLTGLVFGLAPALQLSKIDLNRTLKDGREGNRSARQHRLGNVLIISEVALALVLLISGALLLRTFWQLRRVDPGFDYQNTLAVTIQLSEKKYTNDEKISLFNQQLLQRITTLPGVQSAGTTRILPIIHDLPAGFYLEGRPREKENQLPQTNYAAVSPDYFKAMGIPLLKGRTFSDRDTTGTPRVAIISQTMAQRYFPNEEAIGKRINVITGPERFREIVGIVGDVKQNGLNRETRPHTYEPFAQAPNQFMTLIVRADSDPAALVPAIRSQVFEIDGEQPLQSVRTLEAMVSNSIRQQRFTAIVLSIFAVAALSLAIAGLYGVISYSVAQQTHEIGIRMALGARSRDVLKLVVTQGMKLTILGLAIGVVAAMLLTRLISNLLFGVTATDPLTFALLVAMLLAVALVACYIPARRATKVDPLVALRYE